MQSTHGNKPSLEQQQVSIIVAMTRDRVMGNQQGLPWHLPEDLQLFKRKTLGQTVIMGRKTYQSIGRPLPGRYNIILSRTLAQHTGVQVCRSFIEGLTFAMRHGQAVFIIGGAELYKKALPVVNDLHISWVKENVPGDILFPNFDLTQWSACDSTEYPGFIHIHYKRIDAWHSKTSE